MRVTRSFAAAFAATAVLGLAACSSDSGSGGDTTAPSGAAVTVAAYNFSESAILANIYTRALEAEGVQATIRELTTREVVAPALAGNQVQIVPEYLATYTEFLNRAENGPDAPEVATSDPAATAEAAEPLAAAQGVTLLTPAPAQNQNAFAVTQAFADDNSLASLSDLATYSQNTPITLGGPPECPQRPFCQQGLVETYGVQVGEFVPLDAGGPLTIQSLVQNRIQVGLVFSSSGAIASNNLIVLEDDKGLQLADNVVPAVNTSALTPTIQDTLDAVSAALTTDDLRALNAQVDIERQTPAAVAEEWLSANNLI
jgi:osmoprotectant transport system substrate-binding protein